MSAVSSKQYKAMAAAMSGHSSLGISPAVGKEFVSKTPAAKRRKYAKVRKKLGG